MYIYLSLYRTDRQTLSTLRIEGKGTHQTTTGPVQVGVVSNWGSPISCLGNRTKVKGS